MRGALLIALVLAVPSLLAAADFAPAPAPAVPASPAAAADSLPAGVELIYFHATLRCETCLALEAAIERCLRAEFAVELAEGWLRWRSLDYELAEGSALHAALGLRGSELVIRQRAAGEGGAARPIRSVWNAPQAAAVCDSLRPIVAETLRVHRDADATSGR
jgi:hypothetical protein